MRGLPKANWSNEHASEDNSDGDDLQDDDDNDVHDDDDVHGDDDEGLA